MLFKFKFGGSGGTRSDVTTYADVVLFVILDRTEPLDALDALEAISMLTWSAFERTPIGFMVYGGGDCDCCCCC